MSIAAITINGKIFKISCNEETRQRLAVVAKQLDLEVKKTSKISPHAPFDLVLIMTALDLVDHKLSQIELAGGEVLANANQDFKEQLAEIMNELKIVADKLEKC